MVADHNIFKNGIYCKFCNEIKLKENFTKRQLKTKNPKCRYCVAIYNKNYRINSKNIKIIHCKNCGIETIYKNKNTKFCYDCKIQNKNKSKAKYRNKNKNIINKKCLQKYYDNRDENLIINKIYRTKNKEKEAKRSKIYRDKNKEDIKRKRKQKAKLKRKNDPAFKIKGNISRSIRRILSQNKSSKFNKTITQYLSYTINELKLYLESQWVGKNAWMNWENYGPYRPKVHNANPTWQLDHIIPQSDLPYKSMEDENFKTCWALENLRPLDSRQNFLDGINRTRHKSK